MTELNAKGGGNVELSEDLNVISAEINAYKRIAGEAIFEIGRRLKLVKEENIAEKHGGWSEWLRTIEMDRGNAHKFIKVFEELSGGNVVTSQHLGMDALYLIATLPEVERTSTHVTEKGVEKKPEEMTVKELRELKRQLKEAEQAKAQAETSAEAERKERERLERENDKLSDREPEVRVEYETITEYIEVRDGVSEQRAKEAEERLRKYEERFGDLRNYDEHITASHRQDMIVAVMSFSKGVREFAKRYSYMTEYESVINNLDSESRQQYYEAVEALKSLSESFNITSQGGEVIDAEYSEV